MKLNLITAKKVFSAITILIIVVCSSSLYAFAKTNTGSVAKSQSQPVTKKDNSIGLILSVKGIISKVYVNVGDPVKMGDPLVELNKSNALARLHQAQATVLIQKATLDILKNGAKPNVIKTAQIKRDRASAVLDAAKADLIESLQDAYTKAEDAVKAKADQIFVLPKNINANSTIPFSIQIQEVPVQGDLSAKRIAIESMLSSWKASIDNLNSKSDLLMAETQGEINMNTIKIFMDKVSSGVNSVISDPAFSFTSLRNWRLDLMTGRTNINVGLKSLSTSLGKLNQAQADLDLQNLELVNASMPPADEQIKLQEGKTAEAQAQVELLKDQIDAMTLTSSVDGVVTKVLAKPKMIAGNSALVYIRAK